MRIGIYGGSFNPIHLGHEKVVLYVLEKLKLDKIIVIPVGIPSHKENNLKDSFFRLELCKKVFEEYKNVEVSDIEIKENKISYTYDTLLRIIDLYGKENQYYEIIGEDSFEYFETWRNFQEILKLSTLVVLKRKNFNKSMGKIKDKNIIFLDNPFFNFSSTEIREKIKKNENVEKFLNHKILDLILKNKDYKE